MSVRWLHLEESVVYLVVAKVLFLTHGVIGTLGAQAVDQVLVWSIHDLLWPHGVLTFKLTFVVLNHGVVLRFISFAGLTMSSISYLVRHLFLLLDLLLLFDPNFGLLELLLFEGSPVVRLSLFVLGHRLIFFEFIVRSFILRAKELSADLFALPLGELRGYKHILN